MLKAVASSTQPWKRFMQFVTEIDFDTERPTLEMLKPASAIVRLIDGQREGHYQIPFDWRRLDYSYLPQDKLFEYSYNEAVEEDLKDEKKMY